MRPKDFKRWRKSLGLSQKAAAETLGLKRRVVQYYEKGERDGKDVEIPKAVRLACYALAEGVSDYHGPREPAERSAEPTLRLVVPGEDAELGADAEAPEEDAERATKDKKKAREKDRERAKADKDEKSKPRREKDRAKEKAAALDD